MSEPLDCDTAERYLSDFIANGLNQTLQASLAAHLEVCAACHARAIAMYRQDRKLIRLGTRANTDALQKRIVAELSKRQPAAPLNSGPGPVARLRGKRTHRLLMQGALAATVLLGILLFVVMKKTPPAATAIAQLATYSGDVSVTRRQTALKLQPKLPLEPGDIVTVSANGKASLVYSGDRATVELEGGAAASLQPESNGHTLTLSSGVALAQVSPQPAGTTFRIETPLARTEVLGTRFKVTAAEELTRLEVMEGKVRLTRGQDGEQIDVSASEFVIAPATGPLEAHTTNLSPRPKRAKTIVSVEDQNPIKALAQKDAANVREVLKKFEARVFNNKRGTLPYRIFAPANNGNQKLPLVLFLHSYGAHGTDNLTQLTHMPQPVGVWAVPDVQQKHPCFVVAPQSPLDWQGAVQLQVLELVDELIQTQTVDPKRIYVTGVTGGARGIYLLLQNRPNLFAAAMPIGGGSSDTRNVAPYSHVPVWMFHGVEDVTLSVEKSRLTFEALANAGSDVRYFEYENANHSIYTFVPWTSGFVDWMFSHVNPK